jgi:hypothetical protein
MGVGDEAESMKAHLSDGMNGPLVPAWERSVPIEGARY